MSNSRFPTRPDRLVQRGLKFSQLRLMAALGETGRIGAAAAQLGMTQPAASRILSQLERLMGTALYTRHPRGVTLTEAGRIFAREAAATLRGLDQTHDRIIQVVEGARGLVRVGAVTGPSLELVLPVIRDLRRAAPSIEIAVRIDTSDALAPALLAEEIDFYVGRIPHGIDARPFAMTPIGTEPLALVARPEHPLTRHGSLTLEACLGYDWVTQPPGGLMRRTVETYLLSRGLPLPGRMLGTSSTLFILALVNETDAIAPLARAVADFFIESGAMGSRLVRLPVAGDLHVGTYGVIRRADALPSPAVDRVLRELAVRIESRPNRPGGAA